MSVLIINAVERLNKQNESFVSLIVASEVISVLSKTTQRPYFTSFSASVPTTFSLAVAKSMIGQRIPGSVKKISCEPYLFKTADGQELELDFTFSYTTDSSDTVETVMGK